MNDPRGSIWRKWDLHVHTPASYHWNGGQRFEYLSVDDKKVVISEIVNKMKTSDVDVFGIMDYWTFDGYLKLKDYIKKRKKFKFEKKILPGMEIRVEAPTEFRLNFHFLLSDQLSNQQLSDFKSCLEIRVEERNRKLSNEAFIDLAKSL